MADGPLRIPSARNLLLARAVSGAGSWVQISAASWYVLAQTGSAVAVGILAALTFIPRILGSPVGGWLTDRHDIRRLGFLLGMLESVVPLLIAVLVWEGDMPIPALYVLVFIGAIPAAFATPVMSTLEPLTVPVSMRPSMIANTAVAYSFARVCGPLLGSVLVIAVGVGGAFFVNGLSFWFNAFAARTAKLVDEGDAPTASPHASYLAGVKHGWGFAAARAAIFAVLIFFGLVAPIQQLMPSIAQTQDASIVYVGVLLSAIAVGNIASNPFIRRAMRSRLTYRSLMGIGLLVSGPVLILLGINSNLAGDIALLVVLGAAWECIWVSARTSIQLDLPEHVTGRMLGLFYSAVTLGIAAGSLAMGLMFDYFGTRRSLVLLGVAVCAYGVFSGIRQRRDPGRQLSLTTEDG